MIKMQTDPTTTDDIVEVFDDPAGHRNVTNKTFEELDDLIRQNNVTNENIEETENEIVNACVNGENAGTPIGRLIFIMMRF